MKKALLFGFVFLFCCTISFAQNGQNDDLPKRFANWRERSMMKGCDTTYIQLPEHAWTIKLNGILTFSDIGLQFNDIPIYDHAEMKFGSGVGFKSSFSLAYRGLELGYTIDQTNRYNRDMKLNLYNKRFGGEFQYQSYVNTNSTVKTQNPDHTYNFRNDYTNRMTVNLYYVFNYKTFSYPAAITQAYAQKKSAGSFLLGASFFRNRIKPFCDDSDIAITYNPIITINQASIGAGYGYNLVCCHSQLLFHLSAMPMMLFTINEKIDGQHTITENSNSFKNRLTATIISRAAVCYTYQDRLIIGLNGVYNLTHSNSDSDINIASNGWIIQCCIGWRFL